MPPQTRPATPTTAVEVRLSCTMAIEARLVDWPSKRMDTRLHLKTYVLIAVMVVAGPVGNLLIAKGMKQIGVAKFWPLPALLEIFGRAFGSFTIWAGIACLITFIAAYMLALSVADYSFVQPAAALGYLVVALLAVFVLGESISLLRWAGIAVICLGVSFVRNTHPRTTEDRR